MRILLALLALVGFVLSMVLGFSPTTRAGVQCPTATVQTVTLRDCCGRIVTRVPRPGEREFKQCRCVEKKQGSLKVAASPRNDGLPLIRVTFRVPSAPRLPWTEYVYARGSTSRVGPPAVRPPTVS